MQQVIGEHTNLALEVVVEVQARGDGGLVLSPSAFAFQSAWRRVLVRHPAFLAFLRCWKAVVA